MRLLKIISVFFLIYFIRRFIQMYRVMKRIQEEQALRSQRSSSSPKTNDSIEADYRVVE